jgi:hypothetical protein
VSLGIPGSSSWLSGVTEAVHKGFLLSVGGGLPAAGCPGSYQTVFPAVCGRSQVEALWPQGQVTTQSQHTVMELWTKKGRCTCIFPQPQRQVTLGSTHYLSSAQWVLSPACTGESLETWRVPTCPKPLLRQAGAEHKLTST